MEERNKTLLILVIILSFITVGLSSYIVYDKFIKDDNVEEKKESTNDTSKKEENNNVIKVTDYKKTIGEILNEKKNLKDNVDIILDYGKLGNKEVKVNITGKKEELVYNSYYFIQYIMTPVIMYFYMK